MSINASHPVSLSPPSASVSTGAAMILEAVTETADHLPGSTSTTQPDLSQSQAVGG